MFNIANSAKVNPGSAFNQKHHTDPQRQIFDRGSKCWSTDDFRECFRRKVDKGSDLQC